MSENSVFTVLEAINVNDMTKEKGGLTYLSWAHAWAEVLKHYPTATNRVLRFENDQPYVYDPNTGYMVFTEVTIEGITREMWLPVMDGANKAMKAEPYTYETRYGEKTVEAATMFDINKTIMRCLAKNLAMFGLGLYIFAGEDIPGSEKEAEKAEADRKKRISYLGQQYKADEVWKKLIEKEQAEHGNPKDWSLEQLDKFIATASQAKKTAAEEEAREPRKIM